MAMRAFAACRVDLFLSGHLHRSHAARTERLVEGDYTGLVIHAGTASSTRGRGEANAFNVLRTDGTSLELATRVFDAHSGRFMPAASRAFRRDPAAGWAEIA